MKKKNMESSYLKGNLYSIPPKKSLKKENYQVSGNQLASRKITGAYAFLKPTKNVKDEN